MRATIARYASVWLLFGHLLAAQQPSVLPARIEVGDNIRVSGDRFDRPLVEPQLVAHPTDPRHLIATAILVSTPKIAADEQDCATFVSLDAGRSWSPHSFGIKGCEDPWVELRVDGTAVFAGLGGATDPIEVFQSADGGRTWLRGQAPFGQGHDHPSLSIDRSAGSSGAFYLVSTKGERNSSKQSIARVFVARSADGGRTFTQLASLRPSNLNLNTMTSATLSDGSLAVSFSDFMRAADGPGADTMLEKPRAWLMVSSDRGATFSEPLFVSEQCKGGGFPMLAVDGSTTASRDRLYFACAHLQRTEILVHYSSDRGWSWSGPVAVSPATGDVEFRRTPSLAVNDHGVVGVTWYERPKGSRCQQLYFSASVDGGKTFLSQVRVSSAESCPGTPANAAAAERWPAGGDYSGLAAGSDGVFHAVWADNRNGIYQLYTAAITVGGVVERKN